MGLFNIGVRMDQQPANLEQALAAARAAGVNRPAFKRQSTWQELEVDGHLKRLGWGVLVYLLALAAFWAGVLNGAYETPQIWLASLAALLLSYGFMSLNAYLVQARLNQLDLSKSGAWQVWVGAIFLNPAVIGGYVSLSVFFRARGIKRTLEARK